MVAPPPLTPVPEDWNSALVVVAHPDDIEFCGAAGAVARWVRQGKTIVYALLTSGEAGIDGVDPARTGPVREREQLRSCAAVGVDRVEFLHRADGYLENGIALREPIVRMLRRYRPEVVVTLNYRPRWGHRGGELNQPDHVAAGHALVGALSVAGNRWLFREQVEQEGLAPWRGVRQILAAGSPAATHGIAIDETFDQATAALAAHRVYNLGLRWRDFDPARWLAAITGPTGARMGVGHAVAMEVVDLTAGA